MSADPQSQPMSDEPFHPDRHLPGCMMPDGGECCAGHAAVCEDWHKLTRLNEAYKGQVEAGAARIAELEAVLQEATPFLETLHSLIPMSDARRTAFSILKKSRAALGLARSPTESQK